MTSNLLLKILNGKRTKEISECLNKWQHHGWGKTAGLTLSLGMTAICEEGEQVCPEAFCYQVDLKLTRGRGEKSPGRPIKQWLMGDSLTYGPDNTVNKLNLNYFSLIVLKKFVG